jgi:peptidoglycan/xylan/chitin deacetylase (PgdA/CDA1 family)
MYHDISDHNSVLSISSQSFAAQLTWLKQKNFQVMQLSQVVNRIRQQGRLPKRTAVITFDDGLESVYRSAFPILQEHGFPATVFIVAGSVGLENSWPGQPREIPTFAMMSWEQIQQLDRSGIEIGSHTLTHPRLGLLTDYQKEVEIRSSKEILEERLGHPVESFAYPYGQWDKASLNYVRQYYRSACTTEIAQATLSSNLYLIPRIDIYYLKWMLFFRMLSSNNLTIYLGFRKIFRKLRTWLRQ